MISLVVLAAFVIGAAYRLRHSPEQRRDWHLALAIAAMLFVIHAARAVISGTAAGGCDVRIAVSSDPVAR